MVCGGDVFCLDGECDKAQSGQSNDFAEAVSQLAALAAAGESKTSGKVMVCGGDVFCLDGECDKAQSGQSNDFAEAVSQLAALAAAGKDVAALNGVDVRAFTGQAKFCKAKFCKKAAAGYSNCCKDSGWGQDIGLAKCSSDEKALAKAKSNKLTVSVGEFCSKKVLGVCLQKKRSYCQFDSKLAQIVQQQGRNGQLRIGFGSAKHPDCRGITVDELQIGGLRLMSCRKFSSTDWISLTSTKT